MSALRLMRQDCGTNNLESDPAKVFSMMDERWSFSGSRVAMSALRKEYPDNKIFQEEMKRRCVLWKKDDECQEPSAKQIAKFISWDKIIAFRDEKYAVMTPVQRVLIALYTYIPPVRLDFTPMFVVDRKPQILDDGLNYYVKSTTPYFIFHSYKTFAKYGDKIVTIPAKLETVLNEYLQPGQVYLFQDEKGEPWKESRLSQTLIRVFEQFLGLKTGVSMLRHAYATKFHAGQLPLAEIKKVASSMLHSPIQSMTYRFLSLENDSVKPS